MKKLSVKQLLMLPLLTVTLCCYFVFNFSLPAFAVPNNSNTSENTNNPNTSNDENSTDNTDNSNDDASTDQTTNTDDTENTEDTDDSEDSTSTTDANQEETEQEPIDICKEQTGAIAHFVCPRAGVFTKAVDGIYDAIKSVLIVSPLSSEDNSPTYVVWQYVRDITNIVFMIFISFVIFSQLTGFGVNNYGIKRVLPRIIVSVILINLSYVICTLLVDISNVIGSGINNYLISIEENIIANSQMSEHANVSLNQLWAIFIGGGAIFDLAVSATNGYGALFFSFIPIIFGALIAVLSALATIAARQALIYILVMLAPLAFIAYLFPSTEKLFKSWKSLLARMIFFFPMFSFLIGSSSLASQAVLANAQNTFIVLLGIAIKYIPLIFAVPLMKMAGTPLQAIGNAIDKLSNPLHNGISGWTKSHADMRRANHLANENAKRGAKLRQYLDQRRAERDLSTQFALERRKAKALTQVYLKGASRAASDKEGNDRWLNDPRSLTRNAKLASMHNDRAAAAQAMMNNTLASYGDHFKNPTDNKIGAQHWDAFQESMKQKFFSINQAEADQKALLDSYLKAAKGLTSTNPNLRREYNRLIGGASAELGKLGEASIMGQVIRNSSDIEARRRTEAKIIMTKFPPKKREVRAFIHDCAKIDDNGFELDPDTGEVIVDKFGRLLRNPDGSIKKNKLGVTMHHTPWQDYYGVHKETGKSIEKSQYDALSETEKQAYRKVKQYVIKGDKNESIQLVSEDDAGYMKELFLSDIAIADPINSLLCTKIGNAPDEAQQRERLARFGITDVDPSQLLKDGPLRRYASTITQGLDVSKMSAHDAGVSAMSLAQLRSGYIHTPGQWLIAAAQSLDRASKPGNFLLNDPFFLDRWNELVKAAYNMEGATGTFSDYITDYDLILYDDVNGEPLDGLRLVTDENGQQKWDKIPYDSPDITKEDLRNAFKQKVLPRMIAKQAASVNRKLSPNISEAQKKDGLLELVKYLKTIEKLGIHNADSNIPIEDRITMIDIFESFDPQFVQELYQQAKAASELAQQGYENVSQIAEENPNALTRILQQLQHSENKQKMNENSQDISYLNENLDELRNITNIDVAAKSIMDTYRENDYLNPHYQELANLVETYTHGSPANPDRPWDPYANSSKSVSELIDAVKDFNNNYYY